MTGTDATHRMGDPSKPVTACVQPLGTAMDRSVCHIQQQEMPSVHIPICRPTGSLHRRTVNPVDPDGHGVHLSTIPDHPNSYRPAQTVRVNNNDAHNSIQNGHIMDAGSPTTITGQPNSHLRQTEMTHSSRSSN